jgi:hypothetical protein
MTPLAANEHGPAQHAGPDLQDGIEPGRPRGSSR